VWGATRVTPDANEPIGDTSTENPSAVSIPLVLIVFGDLGINGKDVPTAHALRTAPPPVLPRNLCYPRTQSLWLRLLQACLWEYGRPRRFLRRGSLSHCLRSEKLGIGTCIHEAGLRVGATCNGSLGLTAQCHWCYYWV